MPPCLRILFVCGRNQWRSPTAERIYQGDPRVEVRSAGVSPKSRHQISDRDLDWATLVLVMERAHAAQIREQFRDRCTLPEIESLDIPDDYRLMDPELVMLIRAAVDGIIETRQKAIQISEPTIPPIKSAAAAPTAHPRC